MKPAGADPANYVEVVEAVTALFVATDEKDWSAVRACFADQVLFDMSGLTGSPATMLGADAIVAGWKQGLEPIQALHHQVGNFRVRVESGNEADAFCYGIAYHYRPNVSGQNTRTFVGTYDVHLVRGADGGWLIDRFRFRPKFVEGNLELEKF